MRDALPDMVHACLQNSDDDNFVDCFRWYRQRQTQGGTKPRLANTICQTPLYSRVQPRIVNFQAEKIYQANIQANSPAVSAPRAVKAHKRVPSP